MVEQEEIVKAKKATKECRIRNLNASLAEHNKNLPDGKKEKGKGKLF